MHEYEIVYIFRSSLTAEEIESRLEVFHTHLTSDTGQISAVEHWGKRQLAYPIAKERTGNYVVAQFEAQPAALPEFERTLKLDDDLLRYLIVLSEGELPVPPSMRRGPDERDARQAPRGPSGAESADTSETAAPADAGGAATEEPSGVVEEATVADEAISVDEAEDEDGAPTSDDEKRSV